MKKICIASDHAGFELKEKIKILLQHSGYEITDFGTFSTESVDYPDMVHPLASAVNQHLFKHGIIICGSGNGVSMVANKYSDVRCAVCWNSEIAVLSKLHNNSNILALPARFITFEEAENIVNGFLNTEFEGGRHQKRVNKIKIG
jgi:ribose 5-phosphate isomerase B